MRVRRLRPPADGRAARARGGGDERRGHPRPEHRRAGPRLRVDVRPRPPRGPAASAEPRVPALSGPRTRRLDGHYRRPGCHRERRRGPPPGVRRGHHRRAVHARGGRTDRRGRRLRRRGRPRRLRPHRLPRARDAADRHHTRPRRRSGVRDAAAGERARQRRSRRRGGHGRARPRRPQAVDSGRRTRRHRPRAAARGPSLWNFENVLLTPHNAGHTPEHWPRLADIVAENVSNPDSGEELRNRVD